MMLVFIWYMRGYTRSAAVTLALMHAVHFLTSRGQQRITFKHLTAVKRKTAEHKNTDHPLLSVYKNALKHHLSPSVSHRVSSSRSVNIRSKNSEREH